MSAPTDRRLPMSEPPHPGGRGAPAFDLFLTWALFEGLDLLGTTPPSPDASRAALRSLGGHRGVGSQPGQPPDRWATSYFVLLHRRLGLRPPSGALRFLLAGMEDGTCGMNDGEGPSMWSNWLGAEAVVNGFDTTVPSPDLSLAHVLASQASSGGIGWGPAWAAAGLTELRAAGFALRWMELIGRRDVALAALHAEHLADWILSLQDGSGGFRLRSDNATPCLWATAEAIDLLDLLGVDAPGVVDAAVAYALANRTADGGFRRSASYDHSDLWATRNGVRVLHRAGSLAPDVAEAATGFLLACAAPGGGSTYRPGDWSEAYTTAAGVIAGTDPQPEDAVDFLHRLRMPEDGGIAYMPGRGGEARSLRFASVAAARSGRPLDAELTLAWALGARNPDGGWGVYDGRSSAVNTTCAVLATAAADGHIGEVVVPELNRWIRQRWLDARRSAPDVVVLSQLARIAAFTETSLPAEPLATALRDHEIEGGWIRRDSDGPDLHTTYQALLAHQVLGTLPEVIGRASAWVATLHRPGGTAWSPLSAADGGPLAACFAELICGAQRGARLEDLAL